MKRTGRLAAAVLVFGGCSTAPLRQTQRVRITTFPPGATITVDGTTERAPATVDLDRRRSYRVRAELDGFRAGTAAIHSRSKRVVHAWDYLLLGIPLLFVGDRPPTYELEPAEIEIMLDPEGWSPR